MKLGGTENRSDFPQTGSLRKQPIPSCNVPLRSVSHSHFLSLIKVRFNPCFVCHSISLTLIPPISYSFCVTLDNSVRSMPKLWMSFSFPLLYVPPHNIALEWAFWTVCLLLTAYNSIFVSNLLCNWILLISFGSCLWSDNIYFSFCRMSEVSWGWLQRVAVVTCIRWRRLTDAEVCVAAGQSISQEFICIMVPLAWCLVAFFL